MLYRQSLNALRRAATCLAGALFCLVAAGEEVIDLSTTPVLCNQIQTFKLKQALPDGYVYYYDAQSTDIVLTRDADKANRYTSTFPEKPYIHSCDYIVKKLGDTPTLIACLEQYQEQNPYYVLFAAESPEEYNNKWLQRIEGGLDHCDWLFSVPIDENYLYRFDLAQLRQMLSMLEQSARRDDLTVFNINILNMVINSIDEDGDCEAQ